MRVLQNSPQPDHNHTCKWEGNLGIDIDKIYTFRNEPLDTSLQNSVLPNQIMVKSYL
jgi:hypothetical protein